MKQYDIVVIGGGPAGLAAAAAACEHGIKSILILERDQRLGGILNQCIHNGFGLHTFHEELTGPEYAQRFIDKVEQAHIAYKVSTMVLNISPSRCITAVNPQEGWMEIQAKAIILAMGCRERPRGALNIPGYRPAGIFTAGTAQRLVNMEGYLPGKRVVILGSGDIGLIMARRMTLEGAQVKVVAELMPYSGGLKRNIVQCLDDFHIPLKLRHTVIDIKGKERVESVTLAKVDEKGQIMADTAEEIPCDTLLLSVGLIPENELSKGIGVNISPITAGPIVNESLETSVEGVFACGNILHVHDLVDFVSQEAATAGKRAAQYVQKGKAKGKDIPIVVAQGVRYTVPSSICVSRMEDHQVVRFRVKEAYKNVYINVDFDHHQVLHKKRWMVAPGEMESIQLDKELLQHYGDVNKITVQIERT